MNEKNCSLGLSFFSFLLPAKAGLSLSTAEEQIQKKIRFEA